MVTVTTPLSLMSSSSNKPTANSELVPQSFLKLKNVENVEAYGLGFKIDRQKIAETFDLPNRNDPDVDEFLIITVNNLNRDGYKYIGAAYDHESEGCNVIVLEDGYDKEALAALNVETIDETILKAKEYVLVGPSLSSLITIPIMATDLFYLHWVRFG